MRRFLRNGPRFVPFACTVALACASAKESTDPVARNSAPIVGGMADSTDTWVVGIDIGGFELCSGSMIAPNLVLTARHCVSDTPKKVECAPDGGLDTNKVLGNHPASAFRVTTAQDYRSGPSWSVNAVRYINDAVCPGDVACRVCGYDLALLELKPNGSTLPTSWKPPSNIAPKKYAYTAFGYGCQTPEPGCDPKGFRMMLDPVKVNDITLQEFLILGRVCGGDSGGPTYDPKLGVIYGALSRGDGSDSTSEGCNFGIYTRTDAHIEWLQKYGAIAAKNGGYTAPAWVTAPKPSLVDAGPTPVVDGGAKGPLGSECKAHEACAGNLCVENGSVQRCSQACAATKPCPSGFDCLSGYCWPSPGALEAGLLEPDAGGETSPPVPGAEDASDANSAASTDSSGGCASARHPSDGTRLPWIAGLMTLGMWLRGRRARRLAKTQTVA